MKNDFQTSENSPRCCCGVWELYKNGAKNFQVTQERNLSYNQTYECVLGFRQVYVSKLIHSNCSHTGSRAQMQPQSNVEASSGPQKILLQGNDHLLCPKFTCHTPYVAWPRARVPSLDWVLAPPSLPMGWPWAVNKLHSHVRHPCREYPSHGELWSQNAGVWLVSASLTVGSWEGCWPLSRP